MNIIALTVYTSHAKSKRPCEAHLRDSFDSGWGKHADPNQSEPKLTLVIVCAVWMKCNLSFIAKASVLVVVCLCLSVYRLIGLGYTVSLYLY